MLEDFDGWDEVIALSHQQVDIVEVLVATEAVGKIIAGIHRRSQFVAIGTLKSEMAFAHFRDWMCPAELWSHFLPNYGCRDFGGLKRVFAELLRSLEKAAAGELPDVSYRFALVDKIATALTERSR